MLHLFLVAGLLGGAIPAEDSETQNPQTTIHQQIVVTASLDAAPADQLSATVTVIDRDEIDARQATEVTDLLETVGGLAVVQLGSPGKVTSVFTRGANSSQTLVLWNGVKLNDPFFGGFDWAFLPTQGLDRIEVVRGPFSSLYGSEAIGGVVQLITGSRDGTSARLEGGEDGYLRTSAQTGLTLGRARIEVAGHLRRGDGEVDNDFYDSEEINASVRWNLNDDLDLGIVARANDSEIGIPFDFLGTPSPQRTQTSSSRLVALPVTWNHGNWKIDGQVSQYRADLEFRDPQSSFSRSDTEAKTTAGRVVTTYRPTDRLALSFGGDWQEQEVSNASTFGVNLDGETASTWAAFGQAVVSLGPLRLDVGVRRDDHDAFGSATTSKLGAVWQINDSTRLRASFGEGFRAPSLGELYFPFSGTPDLEPEESESFEVGVETDLETDHGAWRLTLTGFDTEQKNLIQFDFATFTNRNIGRAQARGIELALGWRSTFVSANLAATYLDTEDLATGRELLRRPQEGASLVVIWRPVDRWTIESVARYVGERLDVGDVRLASYETLEIGASFRASQRFEPYVRIENLLDENYQQAAGFPALGRRLFGGIAVRF